MFVFEQLALRFSPTFMTLSNIWNNIAKTVTTKTSEMSLLKRKQEQPSWAFPRINSEFFSVSFNPLQPRVAFLYPKTSENLKGV